MAKAASYEHINPHCAFSVRDGRVLPHFTAWTFEILPWSTPCKNHFAYIYLLLRAQEERVSEMGGVKNWMTPLLFHCCEGFFSSRTIFFLFDWLYQQNSGRLKCPAWLFLSLHYIVMCFFLLDSHRVPGSWTVSLWLMICLHPGTWTQPSGLWVLILSAASPALPWICLGFFYVIYVKP